jgi:hypothetical protein
MTFLWRLVKLLGALGFVACNMALLFLMCSGRHYPDPEVIAVLAAAGDLGAACALLSIMQLRSDIRAYGLNIVPNHSRRRRRRRTDQCLEI